MVVDDEEIIRTFIAKILTAARFDLVLAADGREAVDGFRTDSSRFTLALLDLTKPHMGGEATLVDLQKLHPDVRIVLMSGYDENYAFVRFFGRSPASFLQTLFSLDDLHSVVAKVIS
jgi:two-component system cell cycle sensor histidine kinase/response regulator CckA